jgi:hypothetical protein
MRLGYCTNVHAGADWEQTRANLERHALEVRRLYSPTAPMGIGLWLSARSSAALLAQPGGVEEFAAWLEESGLLPFTLNGFPYGDFHQAVVKHAVYEPTWWQPERADYTRRLIDLLDRLLPAGEEGSISTLPIAWGNPPPDAALLREAGRQLKQVAGHLADLEQRTGRLITVCLEPEPGCVFDTTAGLIAFFETYLLDDADHERVRRYVRVCHDVCHAAVMFEDQGDVFRRIAAAGLQVGKVQVSAAVRAPFQQAADPAAMLTQLRTFNEPRYLHQTVARDAAGATSFYEDLPAALAAAEPTGEWRVHFHVPIFVESFGRLFTSQGDILAAWRAARQHSQVSHFEVETYAWGVLPAELQQASLAAGIAAEMRWFAERVMTDSGEAASSA